jgi:hypothetical protein
MSHGVLLQTWLFSGSCHSNGMPAQVPFQQPDKSFLCLYLFCNLYMFLNICIFIYYLFSAWLEFELRASCLLRQALTTWATPPVQGLNFCLGLVNQDFPTSTSWVAGSIGVYHHSRPWVPLFYTLVFSLLFFSLLNFRYIASLESRENCCILFVSYQGIIYIS